MISQNSCKIQFLIPDPSWHPPANFPTYQGRFVLPMDTVLQVPSALGRPFSLSMSGALCKLGKAPFVYSWMVMSKSGIVKNSFFCIILSNNLVENWDTCFQIYIRNASLCHLPMIIILSGGTLTFPQHLRTGDSVIPFLLVRSIIIIYQGFGL